MAAASASLNETSDWADSESCAEPASPCFPPAVAPPPTAPYVRFTTKPKSKIAIKGARLKRLSVKFTASQRGATFRCSVDARNFTACRSPKVLSNLKPGRHSLAVRATKEGLTGNTARVNFRVVKAKKGRAKSK